MTAMAGVPCPMFWVVSCMQHQRHVAEFSLQCKACGVCLWGVPMYAVSMQRRCIRLQCSRKRARIACADSVRKRCHSDSKTGRRFCPRYLYPEAVESEIAYLQHKRNGKYDELCGASGFPWMAIQKAPCGPTMRLGYIGL